MKRELHRGLFITGTSTHVGKTYVACLIAQALVRQAARVGVYKPVASGCADDHEGILHGDDAQRLWQAAGRPGTLAEVCPQRFRAALAPHLAARAEHRQVDRQLLRDGLDVWLQQHDFIIVEGAGGLMSPLSDEDYVADLALDFGLPLIVVAANEIGVINQTLQTLIVAETFQSGLQVAGVVLCDTPASRDDPSAATNLQELRARCVPPVLAHVTWGQTELPTSINWFEMATPRAAGRRHQNQ